MVFMGVISRRAPVIRRSLQVKRRWVPDVNAPVVFFWLASLACQLTLRYSWAVRSSPAARWPLALALVAAVVGACRQTIGIDQYFNANATPTVCGLPYGTTTCASCANANCCTESTACAASPTCAAFKGCFGECNDPKCWAQCMADHPATGAEVSALSACMSTHCESECGLTCGAFAGVPVAPGTAAACQACLTKAACSATRACAQSIECDEDNRCEAACATYDCVNGCFLSHGVNPAWNIVPDAGNGGLWGQLLNARYQCMPACADWNCVGSVSWPHLSVPTPYRFNFWVKDYVTGKFLPGLDVAVCSQADPDCANPFVTRTTDAKGAVSLPFTNMSVGSNLNEGLDGYLKITSPGFTDNYLYWGSPLSESQIFLPDQVTTAAEYQEQYALVSVTPAPSRGTLSALVFDCANYIVPNVQVTVSSADNLTRGFNSSGVATTVTDHTGLIVFTNVPAGLLQVTAIPPGLGRASGSVSARVYAGASTTVILRPTP
jgi:hypothetical protein